jgi:carnitine 3-dehydrogenase
MTLATPPETGRVQRVAVLGTGVIGASWASHFLGHGLDVIAYDVSSAAESELRQSVEDHWPALERLGRKPSASTGRLLFTTDLEAAVHDVDFVQENAPERVEVKRDIFRRLDPILDPSVVIASSSSGMAPTSIAAHCAAHPERVLVGHPFNPPHLIPLVEVVGGAHTSESAIDRAFDFYTSVGKRPIRVRQELPGHIANRLQAALWREAYSLVDRGAATVSDIDTAIAYGPGLRWALLGPFLNQHLSGGPGGLGHVLEHLGPPMVAWWADLGQPDLTPELIGRLVAGVHDELAQSQITEIADLTDRRDRALDALLAAKKDTDLP